MTGPTPRTLAPTVVPGEPWARPPFPACIGGQLTLRGQTGQFLAERHGTPLFVYDAARITDSLGRLRTALDRHHPATRIAFAAKACGLRAVLELMRAEGADIEVNSGGELEKARLAGFHADQIVFNGVAKTDAELATAIAGGVGAINIDSVHELRRVATLARAIGRAANVALRLVPDLTGGTAPGQETGGAATKFGCTPGELPALAAVLKDAGADITLVGVHVHAGSQITVTATFAAIGARVVELARLVAHTTGLRVPSVNVGGGLPVGYIAAPAPDAVPAYLHAAIDAEAVAAALLQPIREGLGPDVTVIVEPGRSLVADAAVLLTRVVNAKAREGTRWLLLDAGFNVMGDQFAYKWYFHMINATRADRPHDTPFRVGGPLCDGGDVFFDVDGETQFAALLDAVPDLADQSALLRRLLVRLPSHRALPATTDVGDVLCLLDVGAYGVDQVTAYNGRPAPAVVMLDSAGRDHVIRRAQTVADLMVHDTGWPPPSSSM
ncbi:diaminopimelate decarboxylase family protein [Roseospira marina]|nr:alanine racemase [Roseospira marina]MBB4313720.1 diaminopimelate decarboxylase [Roseospira marina]MBB5086882.1 diaminopimelate decarboxylase [Roseospira marina]